MSTPRVKERATAQGWFRGDPGQLRGLLVVSLCLVLASGVTVFGSAMAIRQLTDSLAAVAQEEAGRSARLACAEVSRVARAAGSDCFYETATNPEIQHTLQNLSSNFDIVLASLVSPDGETLTHYYCNANLERLPANKADAVLSPNCLNPSSIEAIHASLIPQGIIPVQEEIWRDGRLLGYVRVFGVSDLQALHQVDPLRTRITAILAFMVCLVFGILMLALAVIYWTLQRQAELLRRAAGAEQLAEIGALAGGLAHEIRNPLQSMGLHLDCALEDIREAPTTQLDTTALSGCLAKIRDQAGRLGYIVDSFSQIARCGKPKSQQVDLAAIVRETAAKLSAGYHEAGITLHTQLSGDLNVTTDPETISRAFETLLHRSREVLKKVDQREVFVSARPDGARVLIEVEDTGAPLSQEEAQTIFRPFSEEHLGRRCIALAMARRFVEPSGATLTAHPGTQHGGARFVLTIPRR